MTSSEPWPPHLNDLDRSQAGPRFGVVLAAGASSRMGRPKALLRLGSKTMLEHHLERLAPWCATRFVAVGAHAAAIRAVVPHGVQTVENAAWASTHPIDSLRLVLKQVEERYGFVVPVDTPPARPETLRRLAESEIPAVPVDPAGLPGHPVLVGPTIVDRVREGDVPGGLRTLLTRAVKVPMADPWVAYDFDDARAWARFVDGWDG